MVKSYANIKYQMLIFSETMQQSATETFLQEKPPRYTYPDPQTQAGRLQKQTDFLR